MTEEVREGAHRLLFLHDYAHIPGQFRPTVVRVEVNLCVVAALKSFLFLIEPDRYWPRCPGGCRPLVLVAVHRQSEFG